MSDTNHASDMSNGTGVSDANDASDMSDMSDADNDGAAAPRRVVGRWGEALLVPDAPRQVAQAVLAALSGPVGPVPPVAGDRSARGADLARPTPASAVTADEPASTARLGCSAGAPPPVAVSESSGTYSAVVPPTFPPQARLKPAAALPVVKPGEGPGPAGAPGTGTDDPSAPEPDDPSAPERSSDVETGVWIDPDDLPMSVEPGGGALAGNEAPRTGPAQSADPAASSPLPLPEPVPRYPEPEPGSGRRRRRPAAAQPPGPAPPARAGQGDGGPGSRRPFPGAPSAPDGAPGPDAEDPARSGPSGPPEHPEATGALAQEPESAQPVPMVTSAICVAGHANPPDAQVCLCCSAPLSGRLVPVPRPALAMVTLSTGASVPVRGDIVVGRAPLAQPGCEPGALLLEVPSPAHLVSRSHLAITTAGWNVLARDLGSNNGTVLLRPGFPAVLLAAALPTPLYVGDLLDVGDGVTLRVEPPI